MSENLGALRPKYEPRTIKLKDFVNASLIEDPPKEFNGDDKFVFNIPDYEDGNLKWSCCFTGDTKIPLLNGTELSLKELAETYANKEFWVYSLNEKKNIVPGKASNPRLTRINAKILEIVLDNGETIRCTEDHQFLMRDNTYKSANLLRTGDSLMPLYRIQESHGYEKVFNPKRGMYALTHRLILRTGFGITVAEGEVIHHKDCNKHNNSPDNLSTKRNVETWKKEPKSCVCQICGKKLMVVGHTHLQKHNISMKEYASLYPDHANDILWNKKLNHVVVSVTNVGYADVYDMEVGKYHNFALSAGVFVHNCVVSAHSKWTRRAEAFEDECVIGISESAIKDEYFKQTNGEDSGLYVIKSLKKWRKEGWDINGKNYKIYAFARVEWKDSIEVKNSIRFFNGISVTFALPNSAKEQKEIWSVSETDSEWGSWGFHQVYSNAYTDIGPIVFTWGKKRQVTWEFWDKYCIECYAIIDDKNKWHADSPVDTDKLSKLLVEALNTPGAPGLTTVVPNEGRQGSILTDVHVLGNNISVDIEVDFGEGIIVSGIKALSSVEFTIESLEITYGSLPGPKTVIVLNGTGYGYCSNAFTVLPGDNPPPDPVPDPIPTPSECKFGNSIATGMNQLFLQKLRGRKGRFFYLNP
jgi:hypothetical protein